MQVHPPQHLSQETRGGARRLIGHNSSVKFPAEVVDGHIHMQGRLVGALVEVHFGRLLPVHFFLQADPVYKQPEMSLH